MRFAADENFRGAILDALRARLPDFDVVRVQDTEMYEQPDPELLNWLAWQNRILLTHDVNTMPGFVFERLYAGLPVPGIIAVQQDTPIGQAIEELEVVIGAGNPADFQDQVKYIPLR